MNSGASSPPALTSRLSAGVAPPAGLFLVVVIFLAVALVPAATPALSLLAPAGNDAGPVAHAYSPVVSQDGRLVVFVSASPNLVARDENGQTDVFLRDRARGITTALSLSRNGSGTAQGASTNPGLAPDGSRVVFQSDAGDLVANDTNGVNDVFVRDLTGPGTIVLASANLAGTASGNGPSFSPQISANGRFVVFESWATNLVAGDDNLSSDVFVRDLVSNRTYRMAPTAADLPPGSRDFTSYQGSRDPCLSADGTKLAFTQVFSVPGKGPVMQVFLRDLTTQTNRFISGRADSAGIVIPGERDSVRPALSADGSWVAFFSQATNLIPASVTQEVYSARTPPFLTQTGSGTFQPIALGLVTNIPPFYLAPSALNVSADGSRVLFYWPLSISTAAGQREKSLFLHDRNTGRTRPLEPDDVSGAGESFAPVMSGDARWVAFQNSGKGLRLLDTLDSSHVQLAGSSGSFEAVFSPGNRFVAFCSADGNNALGVAPGSLNVYLRELETGQTDWVSRPEQAKPSATATGEPVHYGPRALSGDGRYFVFRRPNDARLADADSRAGIWLRDLNRQTQTRLDGAEPLTNAARVYPVAPVISEDGNRVVYQRMTSVLRANGQRAFTNELVMWRRTDNTRRTLVSRAGNRAGHPMADDGVTFQPSISSNGAVVVYQDSPAGVLQLYQLTGNMTAPVLITTNAATGAASGYRVLDHVMSPDGGWLFFRSLATDMVANPDGLARLAYLNAWLRDLKDGRTFLLPVPVASGLVDDDLHPNFGGHRLVYTSDFGIVTVDTVDWTWDFVDLPGLTEDPYRPVLSGDGNYLAAFSREPRWGTNTAGVAPANAYLAKVGTNATLISKNPRTGAGGNDHCVNLSLSRDGRFALFLSRAGNLVTNDANGSADLFLHDRIANTTVLLTANLAGTATGDGPALFPIMSADGSTIIFESLAANLVTNDFNRAKDIFVVRVSVGDMDGDGLPDDWEMANFGTLTRDGAGDFEGDGQSDRQEFLAGTDPTNLNSVFRVLTIASVQSGRIQVIWSAVAGRRYRLQYRDELSDPGWRPLGEVMLATGPTASVVDPAPSPSGRRFYRVLLAD